jgi:recombination protein RecT
MAKLGDIQNSIQGNNLTAAPARLAQLLGRVDIKEKFQEMLGKKSAGFLSSILSLYNSTPQLQACDPMSIIASAAIAATLDLPINQNFGYAYLIPYGNQCQFQLGYKGIIQLAMRTSMYKTISAAEVYEGELVKYNRITGETEIDESKRTSDKIIGYVAYFKLLSGFEKYLFMKVEQIEAHGKKFSKSYGRTSGPWSTNKEAMMQKTPLKLLLSKYGVLSIEMQTGMTFDQAAVKKLENPVPEYIDGMEINDAIEPADIPSPDVK